jgi:hypothetical protein
MRRWIEPAKNPTFSLQLPESPSIIHDICPAGAGVGAGLLDSAARGHMSDVMKFQIGAMSIGDILDRGLKLMLARLPTFYAISLIVLTPLILFQLAMPEFMAEMAQPGAVRPGAPPDMTPALILLGVFFLVLIITLILQPVATGAILHVIAQEFIDRHVGVGQALAFAFGRFWRILGASILAGLIVGLGFLLCLVPGVFFLIWYSMVAQVVVVEGLTGNDALARSKAISEGYRGRLFGLLVLLIVIGAMFQVAAGFLEQVLPSMEAVPGPAGQSLVVNHRNQIINILVAQLLGILVQTYQAVCITLFYFDLRIRKEGFDLELAAQQNAPTAP